MSDTAPPTHPIQRLKVGATVRAAYWGVFSSLGPLCKAALLPFLLALAITLAQSSLDTSDTAMQMLLALVGMLPYAIFAVAWHRFVLLGPGRGAPKLLPFLGRRHLRFALSLLVLGCVMLAVLFLPILIGLFALGGAAQVGSDSGGAALLLGALVGLAAGYVTFRLSFVFPAISVDETYGFSDSWRNTKGQGWSLFAAAFLANLPIAGAGLLVVALSSSPGTEGYELGGGLPLVLGLDVLGYIASALTISILSMAFRDCTGWYPGEDAGAVAPSQGPGAGRLDRDREDETSEDEEGRP